MARSYDGAESFAHSDVYYDETLVDPICAAGLLNYKNVVFFSNPANQMLRVNMTVCWSLDSAETWRGALPVWKGASGYSCLTAVPTSAANESYIGLVFEKGSLRYDESIVFVKIQFWKLFLAFRLRTKQRVQFSPIVIVIKSSTTCGSIAKSRSKPFHIK